MDKTIIKRLGNLLSVPGEVVDHHVSRLEAPRHPASGSLGRVHQSRVQRRTRPGKYIMGAVRPGFDKEEPEMTQEEFNKKFEAALSAHRQKLQDNDASSYSAEARAWAVARGLVQGGGKLPDGTDNFMWG